MLDLTSYINKSIERLFVDALQVSLRNPRSLLYFSQLKKSIKYAGRIRKQKETEGIHIPPFLIASITSSCNLFCTGCYARANHETNACGTLSTQRWQNIFSQARDLGVSFILLAGGEPLLRKDVLELTCDFSEIVFPVFTNGTLIDEKALRLFDQNRNLIPIISVEGGTDTTDKRRGEGVYNRIMTAMRNCKNHSLFYGVSITVTKKNLSEVTSDNFTRELEHAGCSIVFYVEYVPADCKSHDLTLSEEERHELAVQVDRLRMQKGMMFLAFPGDEKATGGCLAAGRGFFHINSAGGAEPCPFSPFSQISLKDHSLTEALQSDFFKKLSSNDFLLAPHEGGCLLWDKRDEVSAVLRESALIE